MPTAAKIICTGTMRTGTSLIGNILSVHPDIQVFAEKVHFFRFIYGRYDPLNLSNVERALRHLQLRWRYRFDLPFDVEAVIAAMAKRELSYAALYEEIMRHLALRASRPIWSEVVAFQWRYVPDFLNMFPDAKAIHVFRDVRGVLASWRKMTFMGENLYLNAIFNWIDSINHVVRFKATLPADRYLAVRFEDIHDHPEATCRRICKFLGIEFQQVMIEPEKWAALFRTELVDANVSSHTGEKVYGFEPGRASKWRDVLERWEVALIEFLAHKQMAAGGYEPALTSYEADELQAGFAKLTAQPFMLANLQAFLASGEGTSRLPNDPTDPSSWGSSDGFGRFADSPAYLNYQRDLAEIDRNLIAKYGR
jgi:hypothetical protein